MKKDKGFNTGDSVFILLNTIKVTRKSLESFKFNARYLKSKNYIYCIKNTPTDILLSILLINVIKHILENSKMVKKRVTNLLSVIGKKLIKKYLNIEYNKYSKWFTDKSQDYILVVNGNSVSLKRQLEFTGFISRFP